MGFSIRAVVRYLSFDGTSRYVVQVSHARLPVSSRPFLFSPYRSEAGGAFAPVVPVALPCGKENGTPCQVGRHLWRSRKTGPKFPLLVVRCSTHKRAMTIYPPGHYPYGRKPLQQLSPDGTQPLVAQEDSSGVVGPRLKTDFGETLFQAALDAAEGRAWLRKSTGAETDRYWSEQERQLVIAQGMTGVAEDLDSKVREGISRILGVELLVLLEEARRQAEDAGYRSRGRSIVRVLDAAPRSLCLVDRLYVAAHLAGFRGPPVRIEEKTGRLVTDPFHVVERSSKVTPQTGLDRQRIGNMPAAEGST